MTDAAVSVTQSAVENFVEQYLRTLDCTIEKDRDRWQVTIPEQADTALPEGEVVLICGEIDSELEDNQEALHPQSPFFQKLLTEASKTHPIGVIQLDLDTEIELPPWLERCEVDVTSTNFTPYYDRTAVVVLYKVSIETVSEYQTELLQAIALDDRTMDDLPDLETRYLQQTSPIESEARTKTIDLEGSRTAELVKETRERVVKRVDEQIDEIHQAASRAADAELEEYRQMQQQRLEELEEELSALTSTLDELSETIQEGDNGESRVQNLKKRKELRSEIEEIKAELEEVREKRNHGFPEKQREIRDRHDLEVVVTLLTISQVEYERGEVEIELREDNTMNSIYVGYGEGVGVTDPIECEECGQPLTQERPLQSIKSGLICSQCVVGD